MNKKPNNVRMALWLAALAVLFFLSVFVKRIWLS
ncbi:cytochrome oxidase small assembly protein [Duganella zoogloeoides]|uniref:Cytochrome oxidase small assembly protein n=1 Tax=Duganella zoogloeoides TaxID=75659 RepID=A0ABZ0XX62_9BURK|nr:cytochrome oxidase small assembly protein [Duganella zoogloeoides]WQH03710.1 cytochrome oxidase small assembly protein [Duganella zoogloeoides]